MLEIHEVIVTPYLQNATILVCSKTGRAAACDVGDAGPVLDKIAELGCELEKIIATHGHLDHIAGTEEMKRLTGCEFWFPRGDDFIRENLPAQAEVYGWGPIKVPAVEHDVNKLDVLRVGDQELQIRHCPGHTPGHVVYFHEHSSQLIAGDVIFAGSVGRTDFPRGSWEDLQDSIRRQIYSLPPATKIHCGHGPSTSVGFEASNNPFVRA